MTSIFQDLMSVVMNIANHQNVLFPVLLKTLVVDIPLYTKFGSVMCAKLTPYISS